jgi:hypothetical protein
VDAQDRTDFITSYTKLLVAVWSDETLGDKLAATPIPVLAQFGLIVPATANVTVIRQIPPEHGDPDVDFQVRLWEKGLETGDFEMHVPQTPQIDMSELSDSELEGITGGRAIITGVGHAGTIGTTAEWSLCCTCTPCSSCA